MSRTLSKSSRLAHCEANPLRTCAQARSKRRLGDDLLPLVATQAPRVQCQRRPFSSSQPWRASVMRVARQSQQKQPSQPSIAVMMANQKEQAIREGLIPDDLGLLPETFIMPFGKNLPGWLSNLKGRLRLERKRAKVRWGELSAVFMYRYWTNTKPKPRLHKNRIPGVAKDLHRTMYEHFAAGNLRPMEKQICAGFLGSLRSRLSKRPQNTYIRWTLHRYITAPKLVSHKVAMLPNAKGGLSSDGILQAVVRIHSLQSLRHIKRVSTKEKGGRGETTKEVLVDAQGRELPAEQDSQEAALKDAKELVEYMVVQKSVRKGKEEEWMLWGTAEETTLQKLALEDNAIGGPKAQKGRARLSSA